MIMNVNDISGFDAMTEEIREVYAERDRLRDENEALRQFKTDICDAIEIRRDARNDTIIKALKSDLSEVKRLRESVNKQEDFIKETADILGVHPGDLTLSDVLAALKKTKDMTGILSGLSETCTALQHERDKVQQDYLNEIGRRKNAERYISDTLSKICSALGMEYDIDTTIEYVLDTIDDLRSKEGTYCHQSFVFRSVCDYLGIVSDDATLSDIRREIEKLKTWKEVAADHDTRRKNWVRKYKSEHERANSCDELYKKYKALYDAGADKREKLSDDLQTYRASYEAVKNEVIRNRSLMRAVAVIVGAEGKHDDVIMANVRKAKKKANHWDVLVDGYGEGTMRSLLDNIGIDVSGDKGNGLFG